MKIDQNRIGGQDLQSKSAQKSENANKQKAQKDRVGGEAKAFKQIFANASKNEGLEKERTKPGAGDEKKLANDIEETLAKNESEPGLEREEGGDARLREQAAGGEFDPEKQRLSDIGDELKKMEVDEQAVLAAAVPELTDASGIQQAAQAAPAAGTDRAEMVQLANKMVQAFYVGHDARAKKIVMMDVNVPGRGSVRVRLSKTGDSVDVRMRADNEDLARLLRAHREDLRESGANKGVNFANIEVVG